eukprot:TRINITY_DN2513_c0_g1_i1.p1 TRINITY_DN2513_c0_g1~~TRINITY_DN2513_c0_g1_i1.p1  ORF type:complete len:169 (+),score=62.28 TRINITY_DN2513_c0_g1_i1:83-589(+)
MVKVNPVIEEYVGQVKDYIEEYRNDTPRAQWGKLLSLISLGGLLVDFFVFLGFVAVVGASWSVVLALYWDMIQNSMAGFFEDNHYVIMSFVIQRLIGLTILIGLEILFVYDWMDGSTDLFFGFSLSTWLISYSFFLFLYTIFCVVTLFFAMRIVLVEQRRAQSLPTLM